MFIYIFKVIIRLRFPFYGGGEVGGAEVLCGEGVILIYFEKYIFLNNIDIGRFFNFHSVWSTYSKFHSCIIKIRKIRKHQHNKNNVTTDVFLYRINEVGIMNTYCGQI